MADLGHSKFKLRLKRNFKETILTKSKILLIGTGAIAETLYLPVLASKSEWKAFSCCVDKNSESCSTAASKWGIVDGGDDYRKHIENADLAIIATPPRSHFPIAKECIEAGLHLIIEKPLTDTYEEGVELIEIAERMDRKVMVNNTRRLFQSYQQVADILNSGELGSLTNINYEEGGVFAWPTASGFYFDPKQGGRGVLSDRGSHVLDLICWWTSSCPKLVECKMDVDGGVEGYCDVSLKGNSFNARMQLSWHNKLSNSVELTCTKGRIKTGIYDYREVTVTKGSRSEKRKAISTQKCFEDYASTFAEEAILAALNATKPPICAKDVLPSLRLIDQCYEQSQPVDFPWLFKYSKKA